MSCRNKLSILIVIILLGANTAPAQDRAELIRSEIFIMEGILDQLLQASIDNWLHGQNIKGVYLADYGLLFTVDLERNFYSPTVYNLKGELYDAKTRTEREKSRDKASALIYAIGGQEDSLQFAQRIKKLDKKIQTFLGAYVDRNNRLLPKEQVGVLAFFQSNWDRRPQGRFFQLRKETIQDFRNDRISEEQFANSITQQNVGDESDREEITIMGTVIKSTISGMRVHSLHPTARVNGVYIKDLGVMFSVGDLRLFDSLAFDEWEYVFPQAPKDFDPQRYADSAKKRRMEQTEKHKEKLLDYKKRIVQCVGNYGPTLRFLPENQSIFVLAGFAGGLGESAPANVMIRIKKADVMQYSQKKLNSDGLLKRAYVTEF